MPHSTLYALLALGMFCGSVTAQTVTVSGQLRDGETGENLPFATVLLPDQPGVGTTSNEYGCYSLTIPADDRHYFPF